MKIEFGRWVLVVVILAALRPVSAQTWVTTTDDYIADEVDRVLETRDGRFLAVAHTGRALALVKRNSDGSLLWQRLFMGTPTGEGGHDVLELPDGRIVAVGDIYVNEHGNDDAALVIVSADAKTVLLQRTFGGPEGDDRAMGVVPTRDGGYLLVGETQSWGTPGRSMFVVRVDSGSNLEWAKVFHSGGDDILYSGVELPTGEFLVVGGSGSVLKLDPSGGLLWSRAYGLMEIREIVSAGDGNFVMAGWRTAGTYDVAELIKLDTTGQILWRGSYGQSGVTYRFFAVASLGTGGYLAGGEINGPTFSDFDGWLVRLDAAGNIVWQRHLNDAGGEVHSVAGARDGSLVVGGHRDSFPRMMIGRLDSMGQVSSCNLPPTLAARIASNGGWTVQSMSMIDPTTLAVRNTNKSMNDALSSGDQTFCQGGPTYPPSEVSPPSASASPLHFSDAHTLAWENGAPSASTRFDVYRGDLADLRSGRGPNCLIGGLASNNFSDGDIPAPGTAFIYVVAGRNAAGRGPLGFSTDGSERHPATLCP